MNKKISDIATAILNGNCIKQEEAHYLLTIRGEEIYDLLYWANKVRFKYFGNRITLCAILSAKQGGCPEDCKFCAQSSLYDTGTIRFPLVGIEGIQQAVSRAEEMGAGSLGIVTSGYSLGGAFRGKNGGLVQANDGGEFKRLCNMVEKVSGGANIPIHASIGCMTEEMAQMIMVSGVREINHNLETSRGYFPNICSTHSYDDRVSTIENAKKAGLKVCSGGIFGMGEGIDDIVSLAFALKELGVDTVPLNFLNPIPGTPLHGKSPLGPMDILKIIACFRFVLPDKEIKVAGGREVNLRDLQGWMFYAGANSTMIGDYLTTRGRSAAEDHQMFNDLGLQWGVSR